MRASIVALEIQFGPPGHPLTSGGSKSVCPMFASGVSAVSTEKPVQPMSFSERTTYSTGHENRAQYERESQNSDDRNTSRIPRFMSPLLFRNTPPMRLTKL